MTTPPAPGSKSLLAIAYGSLRTANEQLQHAEAEVDRLVGVKLLLFHRPVCPCEGMWRLGGQNCKDWASLQFRGKEWWDKIELDAETWRRGARLQLQSASTLDHKVEKARMVRDECIEVQEDLREFINDESRPHVRKLNITDLPDEILLMIFEQIEEGWQLDGAIHIGGHDPAALKAIQHTRLVSRRFRDLSSQLLVRVVRFSPDEGSLERLDWICHHPTFAKGVHALLVYLPYYDAGLKEFEFFLYSHLANIERTLDKMEMESSRTWALETCKRVAQIKAVCKTLEQVAGYRLDRRTEDDEAHHGRLRAIHREYVRNSPGRPCSSATAEYYQSMASALKVLPCLKMLDFRHTYIMPRVRAERLLDLDVEAYSAVYDTIVQASRDCASQIEQKGVSIPSLRFVVDTLNAVKTVGVSLQTLHICDSQLGTYKLSHAEQCELTAGMRHLRDFSFDWTDEVLGKEQAQHLQRFLSACLATPFLQEVRILMRNDNNRRIDVGLILGTSSPRSYLVQVELFGKVAIHLHALASLLQQLPEPMESLSLDGVRLLSGTWEETLDVLREKTFGSISLGDLHGAELDIMPRREYSALMDKTDEEYDTVLERYVKRRVSREYNPLRILRQRGQDAHSF